MSPVVSFVVPCYKLAHLLKECVDSILSQTYVNLEVLIMDDCSPDDTSAVAGAFGDPRVKYVRNEPNLGSLRNYNKGISLAQGKYVWLISADDYLRRPYVVEKYVSLLEANPTVGFVFCPGVGVLHGKETELLEYSTYGGRDQVVRGHRFLKKLLNNNMVLAASGLVRKECYDRLGLFPLDPGMIWSGDWYMWSVIALYYNVGYLAEAMVCYREHELSMTNALKRNSTDDLFVGDTAVHWKIKSKADKDGLHDVSKQCLESVAYRYAYGLTTRQSEFSEVPIELLLEKFEASIGQNLPDAKELDRLRARVYVRIADHYYWNGNKTLARDLYRNGLKKDPWMMGPRLKNLALSSGKLGDYLRDTARSFRH